MGPLLGGDVGDVRRREQLRDIFCRDVTVLVSMVLEIVPPNEVSFLQPELSSSEHHL